ncbi:MAG: TonB-dependent receptor [Alphaproteobacteria bacterium]|nr:TonB-dependent receptor [Alphaproteobacteria bacterium]MBU1512469.1 TonB-dependent receptor [Alphaproteobacteria bacterium]MBU2096607.1 TonB-dependent receptor [Alphaproteobacteria bacterium]MBU2151575.1 TonB-dependent receptor [Alphaproteobacteria bacterium]MBU2307292.1 TonB-dependent receptor [Alphaproteobacteria bacterium]
MSCIAMACSGHAAAQASGHAPEAPAARDATTQIEEVLVTASRRSESIREVPTAISAYGQERLKDAHIASLNDLTRISPNLEISTFTTNVNIAIRGIGTGNLTNAGGDAGVAVHVDGVYIAQTGLAASTFLDVARVEVLRGPQGTLFGRNATGGAINIIPATPTRELAYGFDVTAGVDPTLLRTSGYVSGPLSASGELTGRIAAQQSYNRGFTRNLVPDGPGHLDGVDNYAVRGQLQWTPSETFTARLLVERQHQSDNGPAAFLIGTPDPTFPLPAQIAGLPGGDVEDRRAYANLGVKALKGTLANLSVDWEIGGGHLKALASYSKSDQLFHQDGDATAFPLTSTRFTNDAHQDFSELIYTSDPDKAFSYVVGANLFNELFSQAITVASVFRPVPVMLGGKVKTHSYAFFAHGQYKFTDDLKVFGGVRYSNDAKDIAGYNNFIGTRAQSQSWDKITYEAGVSYDIAPAVTGYAKYATGYKGGGFSAGSLAAPFNPETNTNIELGVKGAYFDGRLQANVAAFHMKYSDLQVNQVIAFASSVTNAAQATIDGVEIESVIAPTDRVRIEASGSWLDAQFDAFSTQDSSRPALGVLQLGGNQLPRAPRFSGSLGGYYILPVAAGTITFGARYDYKSRLYFSEFNIPVSSQKAVGKLDLSVNFKSEDRRWNASAFVTNATDEQARSNVIVVSRSLGSLALGQYQPGRQIGVSLGYHF